MESQEQGDSKRYTPINALILMKGDDGTTRNLASILKTQGVKYVNSTNDEYSCADYVRNHDFDVIIVGEGFEDIASIIENSERHNAAFTVAVTKERVRADVKVPDTECLTEYINEGLLVQNYSDNMAAQNKKKNLDQLGMAILYALNLA